MSVFKDITFEFDGEQYTVKSNNVFRLIAQIEEVIPVSELFSGSPKMTKIAEAYFTCLSYCGADTTVEEVYAQLFNDGGASASLYVQALVAMVIPPEKFRTVSEGEEEKKQKTKA